MISASPSESSIGGVRILPLSSTSSSSSVVGLPAVPRERFEGLELYRGFDSREEKPDIALLVSAKGAGPHIYS